MPYMESPERQKRQLNVLVFHDQAEDPAPILRQLLKASRHSPLLTRVLDACSTALRNVQASEEWPLFDFAEHQLRFGDAEDTEQVAILSVVTCLAQLGCLALALERQPSLFDPDFAETCSIGLCTGSLAAAAAACIGSADDLVAISREIICVAFRLGIEAKRRSRSIDDRYARWSYIVKGVSEQDAQDSLDKFHESKRLPLHRRAYISAVLPHSLTISGPPNTLDLLFSYNCPLSAVRRKPLHICAAFHAEHLLCPNLDVILGNADLDSFKVRPGASIGYPRISLSERRPNLRSVLRSLIEECFQATLYIQADTNPIPSGRTGDDCQIISVGQAGAGETLQDWLDHERKLPYLHAKTDFREECASSEMPHEIAIVGYAGRFPHANSLEEFWGVIEGGKDVHEFIPADRFDAESSYNKMAKGRNTTASPYGCFMKNPGHFDNEFFNMSPREAKQVDPTQRLLLTVTQEALEMSGYTQSTCKSKRIGTFFGQATDDYRESNGGQDIDIFYVGGGMRAFGPGRLNYHYKWDGPSYSIDTACSSSLAALEFAHRAVQFGDCDIAIAGGGNLLSALPMFSGLSKGRFTSSTGSCKTFDEAADGYCRGEGVGVVVIKRLEDAISEEDNVKGIVSSIVTNHSAKASSITHPHAPTQEALFLRTLSSAGLDPCDVDYVEFHGTGTQAGDAAELSSVSHIFGGKRNRSSQLCVGAVKANVGHGEAAAGVTSLIKGLLMIEHDTIPPHCGIKNKPNPALESKETVSLKIPDKPMRFGQSDAPRTILINNFNATGGNTSLILRGPPQIEPKTLEKPRSHYPVTSSANSVKSLQSNLKNLHAFVKRNKQASLADVSFSTTARRLHFQHRMVFVADSTESLLEQLDQSIEKTSEKLKTPSVAFAFSGQGTQKQGIAKDLYETCSSFRQALDEYDAMCSKLGFSSFLDFLINPDAKVEFSATQLQLGTVAVELALAMMWQAWGLQPGSVIGHSLGEYPALCIAGVLSITDMFSLVGERARLMENLIKPGTHAMLSVSASAEDVRKHISNARIEGCEVSCYNAAQAIAVSGPVESLEKLQKVLSDKSVRAKKLDVKYAFHSAMIEPILDQFTDFASSIPFHEPRVPVASTLLGSIVQGDGTFGPQYLRKHARHPVQFVNALRAISEAKLTDDKTVWIEVGPGDASCLSLIQRAGNSRDKTRMISSFSSKTNTWQLLSRSVADCYENGVNVEWAPFHDPQENQLNFLDLPTYAFETKDYWIPLGSPGSETSPSPKVQEKLTPLLHYVDSLSLEGKQRSAEFSSELSDPVLFKAIKGHQVFDAALCPSSVYSTIALEAATYVAKKLGETDCEPAYEIYRMDITRPLVVNETSNARLQISVAQDGSERTTVQFSTEQDGKTTKHAKCEMKTSDSDAWRSEWSRMDFLAHSRVEMLEKSTAESHYNLPRPVIYKLFTHVVNYDEPYHGLKHVVLDNENQEAAADIEFESPSDMRQNYDWHLMDTLIHLAGFILNNGLTDKEHAFISDGWDSLRIPPAFKKTDKYKAHVRLAPSAGGQVYSGDAYMFLDGKIVASCSGVRFSKMKLKSLKGLLSKSAGLAPSKPADRPATSRDKSASRPASPEQPKSRSSSSENSNYAKIMSIIAEESGVPATELNDTSKLSELGLDSILITAVVDQIKDQTGVDISSTDLQSIGCLSDIKALLPDSPSESSSSASDTPTSSHPTSPASASSSGPDTSNNAISLLRNLIATESGASPTEVDRAAKFDDLGVDSLLSLEILSTFTTETGRELHASFLKDNPNMAALTAALESETPLDVRAEDGEETNPRAQVESGDVPEAKITLLQGSPASGHPPLFLLPPGMGTPSIYTTVSRQKSRRAVYGLTSPFIRDGTDRKFTWQNYIGAYMTAILKTRSDGGLHLAGWSLGGAAAFSLAHALTAQGRDVSSLVIIDCPPPSSIPLRDTPTLTIDALNALEYPEMVAERHGAFPEYMLAHTVGIMNAFKDWTALPIPDSKSAAGTLRVVKLIQATHGSQEGFMRRAIAAQRLLGDVGVDAAKDALKRELQDSDYVSVEKSEEAMGAGAWGTFFPTGHGVDVQIVSGDHVSIVTEKMKEVEEGLFGAVERAEE